MLYVATRRDCVVCIYSLGETVYTILMLHPLLIAV